MNVAARRLQASVLKRVHRWLPRLSRHLDRNETVYAAVLSRDPAIVLARFGGPQRPLRRIRGLSLHLAGHPATFLLSPTWALTSAAEIEQLRAGLAQQRREFPEHGRIFLCNTAEQESLLADLGERAVLLNFNAFVSETEFRPLDGTAVEFDAVYNAKLEPWKRHELAFAIPRVAYVTYTAPEFVSDAAARQRLGLLLARAPSHAVVNRVVGGLPVRLAPSAVNEVYRRSAVGLCLSEAEGQMRASMEYLLAGLPVVSTPSVGGRDLFFDPDYCLTVTPEPGAVREAVAALRARNIPRGYIRERTLEKIEPHRRRLLALLDSILEGCGRPARFGTEWPYRERSQFVVHKPVGVVAQEFMHP